MEETIFSDSSTSASQKRVKAALTYSLKNKYEIEDEITTRKILKIHGLDVDNFDVVANTERTVAIGMTDTSIDQNSNKNENTISGLLNEAITNPYSKVLGHRYLYRKMKEMYGKNEAKKLSGEMYDFSLAISDSTKILSPYCYAFDFTKLVLEGRPWGQLHSAPPNRLTSYVAALTETVHQLASNIAGAVAVSTFFLDSAYVLLYREKFKGMFNVKYNRSTRKYIQNSFQSFVHSVNHLSRNSIESPFTNISIFDKPKLIGLLSKDNMAWYFDKKPKWFLGNKEKWIEYVIDYIMELQDIYMKFFDKGDKLAGGKPFRFPVSTLNVSKSTIDGKVELLDTKFIEKISKKEIFRYNIMVSENNKFANCCRLISQTDMFDMGGQVSSLGLSAISLGSHRVVTINFNRIALESKTKEEYFTKVIERARSAALILKAHKELIADTEKWGYQPFITNGYIKMERLFSTFGVLGIVEAAKNLATNYGGNEKAFIEETLVLLNSQVKALSLELKITGNIEQIPGETLSVKLHDVDALLYPNKTVSDAPLYSNQFISLWEDCSIWDRMDMDGSFNKLYTGGGIVHFNLGERPTAKQIKNLIYYSAKSGSEHFALNAVYSECENEHTTFGNHETCPVCNAQIMEKYQRVVGFFTPVSSWNKVRREWEFPRRVFKNPE